MSIKQMTLVWEHEFPPNKQLIMLSLADHANDEGGSIYPSYERTAWKTGYSKPTVQRVVTSLVEDGVLVMVRDSGHHRPKEYKINWKKAKRKEKYKGYRGDNSQETETSNDDARVIKDTSRVITATITESSVKPSFLNHNDINYNEELHEPWLRMCQSQGWCNTKIEKDVLPIKIEQNILTLLVEDNHMKDWVQSRIFSPGNIAPIMGAYKDFNLQIKLVTLDELKE